jgi:prevent-host-death family protein
MRVGMHEAKTQLSRLVERARGGEEVIVERSGHPVARIVAYEEKPLGLLALEGAWKGRVRMKGDFKELPLDLQRAFGVVEE